VNGHRCPGTADPKSAMIGHPRDQTFASLAAAERPTGGSSTGPQLGV